MKGLFLKEIYYIKAYGKEAALGGIILIAITVLNKQSMLFLFGLTLLGSMASMNGFSLDEKSGWDQYVKVLDVSNLQIVLCKYVPMLLVSLIAIIAGGAEALFTGSQGHILINCYIICAGIIFQSAVLPVLFRFGPETARYAFLALIWGPAVVVVCLRKLGIPMPGSDTLLSLLNVLPAFTVIFVMLSVTLSVRIVKKSEY